MRRQRIALFAALVLLLGLMFAPGAAAPTTAATPTPTTPTYTVDFEDSSKYVYMSHSSRGGTPPTSWGDGAGQGESSSNAAVSTAAFGYTLSGSWTGRAVRLAVKVPDDCVNVTTFNYRLNFNNPFS